MKMVKIINPCKCDTGRKYLSNAFAKITYENGNLSIVGVIGPTTSGGCKGSAGQCVDKIRGGTPTENWTPEMLRKFCDIWDEWHLNDMHPYCKHMKELSWDEQARETVKITKWDVKTEVRNKAKDAEKRAIQFLKSGKTFIPTPEETMYANVGYGAVTYNDELPKHPELYEFKEKDCLGHSNVEYKTRGWIRYTDHELGFIGKPCPVCGYEYGTQWIKEEVPREVIDFLFNLPETKITPAWV